MQQRWTHDPRYDQFNREYYCSEGYENYFDEHTEIAEEQMIQPLIDLIHPSPDWMFLDVGCAMGGALLSLRKRGLHAEGTDVSSYCLEHAPAKQWMRFGESFNLPFPDHSFDVLTCANVFQYLTREQALRSVDEFTRVARKYISLWVFDPEKPSWSQVHNPDPVRREDTRSLTNSDYIERCKKNGAKLITTVSDFSKNSDMPEWHLLFGT
jgi:ubiquinone/menaquinone biosynthesis C-methylase UbiE